MIRNVVALRMVTVTHYRAILECGHMYTRPLASKDRIKRKYVCWACRDQKAREERGAKPNLNRRKNKI